MEFEMYEEHLPINQQWEVSVARNNTMPALSTSACIQYEGSMVSDGSAERVALKKKKWEKHNWSDNYKLTNNSVFSFTLFF